MPSGVSTGTALPPSSRVEGQASGDWVCGASLESSLPFVVILVEDKSKTLQPTKSVYQQLPHHLITKPHRAPGGLASNIGPVVFSRNPTCIAIFGLAAPQELGVPNSLCIHPPA